VGAPRPCLCPAGVLPGGSFRRMALPGIETMHRDASLHVVRKLLDIDFKISTVHEEQKNINTKLDSIQNQIQTIR